MYDCEFCANEIDYHEIIDCITCAPDARDPYTAGHSERVSDMALKVCQLIGLKDEKCQVRFLFPRSAYGKTDTSILSQI